MNGIPTSRHHIKFNAIILVWRLFWVLFVINTLYGFLLLLVSRGAILTNYTGELFNAAWVGHIVVFVVQAVALVILTAGWLRTNYYLTDGELVLVSGIVTEKEVLYKISDVRSITLRQSWPGRIFNYGTLIVYISASGGYHETVRLKDIKNPKVYEHALREGMKLNEGD